MAHTLSPYENPSFARQLTDFPVDERNRAMISAQSGITGREGYDRIGKQTGKVVELATGLQMLTAFPNEVVGMRLFGSGANGMGPDHHIVFTHGNLGKDSYVTVDHNCRAAHLDIDCGCRACTRRTLQETFGRGADSAAYITVDSFTPPENRIEIARNMMEALGVQNSEYIYSTPGFDESCDMTRILVEEGQQLGVFEGSQGAQYIWTHDVPVTFHGGLPARLIVIQEPQTFDKKGYGNNSKLHEVLVYGDIHDKDKPPVMRYHSSCITAELGGNGCDCESQQARTMHSIAEHGSGIFILAEEEGMGSNLSNKLWQTQMTGSNEADLLTAREKNLDLPGDIRSYDLIGVVRQITGVTMGLHASNNHLKKGALERNGIEVVGHVSLPVDPRDYAPQALADFLAKQHSGRYSQYYPDKK